MRCKKFLISVFIWESALQFEWYR